jgi:anti-sigma-K factor RskA
MNCDELRGNYEWHAMGLLASPEKEEVEEHLRRNCPVCTEEMRRARETNAILLGTAPEAAPPERLRRRVLSGVGVEPRRSWLLTWLPWGATAAASAAAVLLFLSVDRLERRNEQSLARSARWENAVRMMAEPETKQVTFGKGTQGRVLVNPTRGVLLLASNLPPAPAGKTYELWIVPKDGGAPRPAGLFQSDASGNAMHMAPGPVDMAATAAVAVSMEPEAGSPAPTTTPIIVTPVGDE